jgi:hypothetical protein
LDVAASILAVGEAEECDQERVFRGEVPVEGAR